MDELKHGAFHINSGENWLALVGKDKTFVPVEPAPRSHGDFPRVMAEWDKITGEKFGYPYRQLYKEYHRDLGIWEKDERGSFNAVVHFLRQDGSFFLSTLYNSPNVKTDFSAKAFLLRSSGKESGHV